MNIKFLLIYLAGVATPFLALAVWIGREAYAEWKISRRYQRAWDHFCAQFDRLTPEELTAIRERWALEPWHYDRFEDDRSRYFDLKWEYGRTKEV